MLAHGYDAAEHAHDDGEGREPAENVVYDIVKRDGCEQGDLVDHGDDDAVVDVILDAEGDAARDKADQQALDDKGRADEVVGRPDEFHDVDFGAAREDRDADGVGNDEQRDEQQHDGDPDPDHGDALAQVDKLFDNALADAHAADVVELLDIGDRLGVQLKIDDFQMVRIAQRVVFIEAVEQDRLFLELLLVLLPAPPSWTRS